MSASITTWIGKLRAGDSVAAEELWHLYYARLVSLARHKLGSMPRQISDEEDIALSAFHSFCQAVENGRFPVLESRDDLWQILVMHTARKTVDQRRYLARQKRSGAIAGDVALDDVVGGEPDPEFAASVAEEFERHLRLLDDELLRSIALLKLEGYSNEEIATKLNWSLRTVERKLAVIRAVWTEDPATHPKSDVD